MCSIITPIWVLSDHSAPTPALMLPVLLLLQAIFEQVEFKQANLANPASAEKVFHCEQGGFDYVFNLAAETKYSQSDEVIHYLAVGQIRISMMYL